jgi:hypothetical protein
MSLTLAGRPAGKPVRRVRHEVRDGIAVIAFSAAASTGLATVLLLFLVLVDWAPRR